MLQRGHNQQCFLVRQPAALFFWLPVFRNRLQTTHLMCNDSKAPRAQFLAGGLQRVPHVDIIRRIQPADAAVLTCAFVANLKATLLQNVSGMVRAAAARTYTKTPRER